MEMRTILPEETATKDLHQYLLGTVAPRPIALVSTMDSEGTPNLAPYSFYNAFSSNPPIVVFSSNRRVDGNTTKDTLLNVQETGECVINSVTHDIVRQMAISSVSYPRAVNEFEKAGFTTVRAKFVQPYRVAESPAHIECRVRDIITLGKHGGAGHLVICDVLCIHIAEHVIDERNRIDPHKMDLMGRLGRAYYARASGDAVQTIVQAVNQMAIGFDALPASARSSRILTGNALSLVAGLPSLPDQASLDAVAGLQEVIDLGKGDIEAFHVLAGKWIDAGRREEALALLYLADRLFTG